MTFCANARGRIISAILVVIAVTVADVCLAQDVPAVRINVHNESGAAIAGATVRIQSDRGVSIDTITGTDGRAAIPQLAPGEYRIVIAAEDFQQLSHLVSVQSEGQEIDLEFTLVPELRRTDSVDVIAGLQDVGLQPSSLASEELRSADVALLPLRPSTVVDALPLVPGVNRSSDGEIQIGGQGEQRSALLVNTSNVTDPGTGRFTSSVPADSVESVEVLKTPFLPRYGSFTSGVVAVETKRGGEKWRGVLKEFIPSFRIRSRHIRGLRDALPRLSFGGPILKNRLFFSEAVQYRFEKRQTRTLSFPHNESKNELVNSFSQFDYIISPGRFITATVHVTPHHINFVDPQFFNPQPVTPNLRGYDRVLTVADHANVWSGLLDSSVTHQVFRTRIGAQGEADMVLTPIGNFGNYFGRRNRNASRTEWTETFSFNKGSAHALKIGSILGRLTGSGSFDFRPVEIRDADGQTLERIEFTGGSPYEKVDMEEAFFVQDHWTIRPNLSLDGGARVEHQHNASAVRVGPRIALAWNPLAHDQTVVRGGFGVFYDRVPLAIYSFAHRPEQIVTVYDRSSGPDPVPRRFGNMMEIDRNGSFPFIKRSQTGGNFAPYSTTWSVEMERRLGRFVNVRTNYQHTTSGGGILLTEQQHEGRNVHALGAGGHSTYRQFEATARLSWERGQQMLFSYVRSKALGDLNTFTAYLGDFPTAPLRPNHYTNTRGDIPHRFIAWGIVNLPWNTRLAPIFEYRSGQPYAILEARRHYVGIPYNDKTRFRNYISLDERMSKDIKLLAKYTARLSVSVLNVFNRFNPLDVHANTADPLLGVFFGHFKRRYRADFEILF